MSSPTRPVAEQLRTDCCDHCCKYDTCKELPRRCVWTKGKSCRDCLPCEAFAPRAGRPFRSAIEILEGSL